MMPIPPVVQPLGIGCSRTRGPRAGRRGDPYHRHPESSTCRPLRSSPTTGITSARYRGARAAGEACGPTAPTPRPAPSEPSPRSTSVIALQRVFRSGTAPRIINDYPVSRACWQWSNLFDCVTADAAPIAASPASAMHPRDRPAWMGHDHESAVLQPRAPRLLCPPPIRSPRPCRTVARRLLRGRSLLGHELSARRGFRPLRRLPRGAARGRQVPRATACRCSRASTTPAPRSSSGWSTAAIAAAPMRSPCSPT